MAYEKIIASRIATLDTQDADLLQVIGGASGSGTTIANPLSSEKFWTSFNPIVNVTAVSATWIVEIRGTINGVTNFPFYRRAAVAAGTTSLNSLFNSPGCPVPQYVNWDTTAGGGPGITATVACVAKTIRGKVRGSKQSSFNVYEGRISSVSGNVPGSGVNGITGADKTHILSANSTSTAPSVFAGLDKFYIWDSICYGLNVTDCSGSYIVNVLGLIDGQTTTLATSPTISAVTQCVLTNTFYGASVRPHAVHFDYISGGGTGLTAAIHYMAVATRGVRHK